MPAHRDPDAAAHAWFGYFSIRRQFYDNYHSANLVASARLYAQLRRLRQRSLKHHRRVDG